MRPLSFLPTRVRLPFLIGASFIALALGCSVPPITTEEVIEVKSCVDGARSVRLFVEVNPFVISASAAGASSNVIGTPDLQFFGPGVQVTAELDSIALGDAVTLLFSATASAFEMSVAVTDIVFYTVPPDQIPPEPECSPSSSPEFALANDAVHGLMLEASNPSGQPMTLESLELVRSPSLLPISSLDWTNPDFNALPWQPAVGVDTPLDPAAPPLVIDLPDEAMGASAALLRFVSLFQGEETRGIMQARLAGTVATEATTWGAVKALYRN